MNPKLLGLLWLSGLLLPQLSYGQSRPAASTNLPPPMMLTVEGTNVWIQRARTQQREDAYPNQILELRDHGYTGRRSRATVRLSDLSVARISESSEFVVEPLPDANSDGAFSLLRGLLYLLHRDRPGSHRFRTPTATAATRGTEFTLEVEPGTGRTLLTVLEGEAELRNEAGVVLLGSREQGIAELGQAPFKTAVIDTTNLVQWCLYYPGVLNVSELELTPAEQTALAPSLTAWRAGALLQAVADYPTNRVGISPHETVYAAALLLAVGQVPQAEQLLASITNAPARPTRTSRLSQALRQMIDAVKLRPHAEADTLPPQLSTEWLAGSYAYQATGRLGDALAAARRAAGLDAQFAFAWVRIAELEFGYGRIAEAQAALEQGLVLAPRHAQALALRGFLLSAQNRTGEAIRSFEEAMELDGGLGNAWLGRGLCRIRRGDAQRGRFDLQVAATLEPQRSLLRSYLGKAFSNAGDSRHAQSELDLARQLDAGDPTPWLYSALLLQQQNRLNEAVRDLEHSQDLNDNRQVYRSRLALDQDRAVRGANLAAIYRDAGLNDVSLREAGRAVTSDYANDAAHLFLANSYNQLRDPKRINLRYETATLSEYLVGNLLAPVGAGALSQPVSQQEYGRLLERDGVGLFSSSEYRSNGDWLQLLSQFGTFGNTAYAADFNYRFDNGARPNNELEQFAAGFTVKQQLTPADSVLVQATYYQLEAGDVSQYYDQSHANPVVQFEEKQQPIVLAGYHHQWSPGSHTLFLAGRLQDVYEADNPRQNTLFVNRGFGGPIATVAPMRYDQDYRSELEIYSGELQQIWQRNSHTLVLGARLQGGQFETHNRESNGRLYNGSPVGLNIDQEFTSDFDRESIYLYDHWQVWETLLLAGGVTYDHLGFPQNYRYGPISDAEVDRERVSPKAGFVFTPRRDTTFRGAYARGLGGVSLDQSYRLEPSQVAGFNQAYRSLIPESVAGANAAPNFEQWSLSLEQRFGTSTYLGLGGEILSSDVNRQLGVVQFSAAPGPGFPLTPQQTRETLDFQERTLFVSLNQLVGQEWSFGARYRLSQAELEDRFPGIPATAGLLGGFQANQELEALIHQVHLSAYYNHASGFFGGVNSIWTTQSNHGYNPDLPGDDFWQFNVEAGWRFFRRRLETSVALLNLTDQDYQLNPLNLYTELPRERTLAVRLQFNF